LLVVALFAAVSLSSCGGTDRDSAEGDNGSDARKRPASTTPPDHGRDATTSASTSVRISFGDTKLTGRLLDNATARDLAAQLPLTLTFRDHNNVEKGAPLPRELSVAGAPAGHDPVAGDIGYWAPDGNLVLYYDDQAPYWNGIVRIGQMHGALDALRRLPEGARVSIEVAN
jgi:hypothetical protein